MNTHSPTNFATPRTRRPGRWALLFWLLALLGTGFLAWSWTEAEKLRQAAQGARAHAATLKAEIAAAAATTAGGPASAEIRALGGRIAFFNALAGDRHTPLSQILTALEGALPNAVWCRNLTYDVETGILSLSLLGRDAATLPAALEAVEALEILRDVILERQVQLRQGQETLVQYDVKARAL